MAGHQNSGRRKLPEGRSVRVADLDPAAEHELPQESQGFRRGPIGMGEEFPSPGFAFLGEPEGGLAVGARHHPLSLPLIGEVGRMEAIFRRLAGQAGLEQGARTAGKGDGHGSLLVRALDTVEGIREIQFSPIP